MEIIIDKTFNSNDIYSSVTEIEPDVFKDNRGFFTEVLKEDNSSESLVGNLNWIRQINRSSSKPGVIRGMHAQKNSHCQSKLIEVISGYVYDVIIDARPQYESFGTGKFYLISSSRQNKLYVPRGFLHGFIVPEQATESVIFNYYCDNVFNRESEITINPKTVLPRLVEGLTTINSSLDVGIVRETIFGGNCTFSEKDTSGTDYETFMKTVKEEFDTGKTLWYNPYS